MTLRLLYAALMLNITLCRDLNKRFFKVEKHAPEPLHLPLGNNSTILQYSLSSRYVGRIHHERTNHRRSVNDESESDDLVPIHKRTSVQYSSLVGPSFANDQQTFHALAGQTAHLDCFIKNLHNYTVSWIRASDINLLASADVTYSSDNRFVAMNPAKGLRWVLKIHHAKVEDSGTYLCQVSTSPPIDFPVHLSVTEAMTVVYPASEVFLKVGSPVRLVCRVYGCPYPTLPAWYKNGILQDDAHTEESRVVEMSSYISEAEEGRSILNDSLSRDPAKDTSSITSVQEDQSFPYYFKDKQEFLLAETILQRAVATTKLSGIYSCTNTCTPPVNLTLNVLTGDEETAAMQHINSSKTSYSNCMLYIFLISSGIVVNKSILFL